MEARGLVARQRRTGRCCAARVGPGKVPISQLARVADDLLLIVSATQSDEWVNRIVFLPI